MKILLVDDHALFRKGLKFLLRSLDAALEVDEAGDCAKALEHALARRCDRSRSPSSPKPGSDAAASIRSTPTTMNLVSFRHSATAVALSSSFAGCWTSAALGAGFAILEQSASGLGNGFAGAAAAAEDASTVYWNPAGMLKLPTGKQFVGGGHYFMPSIRFSDGGSAAGINRTDFGNTGGNAGGVGFVPNVYFAMDLSPTMKFGFGINVPFASKIKYDPAWLGRFQGIESEITTLNVNPSIAWKAGDKIALGIGVNYQTGEISVLTGVNYKGLVAGTALDPAVAANAEGQNQTDVHGDAWGYNFGALFDLDPDTRFGVAYRSSLKYTLSGTTRFSNVPGAFAASSALAAGTADGNVNLAVNTPDSLSVSLVHQANWHWMLLADATCTNWSMIQSLPLVRDTGETVKTFTFNFRNAMRYSAGANYRMTETFTLKMGFAFDQSPVPSAEARTVGLPENDRTSFSFGAKSRLSGAGTIDFGYTYINIKHAPINNIQNDPMTGQGNGNVIGSYKSAAHVVGVQYVHAF